jgi:hypothetical protein
MSLSSLLDIPQPQDLLKGLISTLQEYEQSREDSDQPKIVRLQLSTYFIFFANQRPAAHKAAFQDKNG